MFLRVIAVQNPQGISKNTGNPFSMHRVVALGEFDSVNTKNYQLSGNGCSVQEVEVSQSFFPKLLMFFSSQFDYEKSPIVPIEFKTSLANGGRSTVLCDFSDAFKAKYFKEPVKQANQVAAA
jgi:hypothetical protein